MSEQPESHDQPTPHAAAAYDYDQIRKELVRKLGSADTVTLLVQQKQKELAGYVTPEGALLLLANLQGIDTAPGTTPSAEPAKLEATTIAACRQLKEGTNVHLKGAIVSITGLREATRKDGTKREYRVATFGDTTGQATLTLWGSDAHDSDQLMGKPLILENVRVAFYEDTLQLKLTKKSHVHIVGGPGQQHRL